MTTVINLYGGPGTGKSTSAAYLFARLKERGVNAELVREYVKDWAWEGRQIGVFDQIYFLGKQVRRESFLLGKVDVIVTDSPGLIGPFFAGKFARFCADSVLSLAIDYRQEAEKQGHRIEDVFLRRTKPYNPAGRYQTEDEASRFDHEILSFLLDAGGWPRHCDTDFSALDRMLDEVLSCST